ncbi:MAG: NUDIX domain-containing protein [Chloroflexi bacterium]|nr:NUDIX domain-containing protein [Chloroflexota bacterium]
MTKTVKKVVAYITRGDELLVFTHRDFPEAGVQVPAGTVEEGETLDVAVLREVHEETGLSRTAFRIATYLGRRIWQAEPKSHDRYFFHLLLTTDAPESWLHNELYAGTGETITFCFSWVRLDDPNVCLAGEQGALLWKLPC